MKTRLPADGEALIDAVVGASVTPPEPLASPFVDWSEFWARDRTASDWLHDDILARGRGHAIYASHKAGKSLLALWIVKEIVRNRSDVVVVYLDYEMTGDDLFERLVDMGCGPDTDLSRLRYALLPSLPPLDTAAGANGLEAWLDVVQAQDPSRHLCVVIDTMGRAVSGEENSSDTFRAFYSHTGIRLKRRECTWVRLDHAGKDLTLGQRGSSGKGDDVDVIWQLRQTQEGVELRCDAARMSWVPERVTLAMRDDPLRYVEVVHDWPAGTREIADLLSRIEHPVHTTVSAAVDALREAGHGRRKQKVASAVKFRKMRPDQDGGCSL